MVFQTRAAKRSGCLPVRRGKVLGREEVEGGWGGHGTLIFTQTKCIFCKRMLRDICSKELKSGFKQRFVHLCS